VKFPPMKVRDLEGVEHVLPYGLPGGPHVIVMAFHRWQQTLVDAWRTPLEQLAQEHPGMEIWEVPSISKGYRVFRSGIDGGMRAAIPDPDIRRHTLTTYPDISALARALELGPLDTVYVFLVDCEGNILWRAAGEPSEEKLRLLEAAVPETC
jgi:hypothetical protein